MGYAYEWLTGAERNNITQIKIRITEHVIDMQITAQKKDREFKYTKDVEGHTSVVDVRSRKDEWINKFFVDVAYEDIHLLLVNQNSRLGKLSIETADKDAYNSKVMDPIITKVFEKLSESLESRSSLLRVSWLDMSPTKVSEGMSIICHLNHRDLIILCFRFGAHINKGNLFDIRNGWNHDRKIYLNLRFSILTEEDLIEIRELDVRCQDFHTIRVDFDHCDQGKIEEYFGGKLEEYERSIDLKLERKQLMIDPLAGDLRAEDNKSIPSRSRVVEQSSTREELSLGVLGSSVIMKEVLAELQRIDIQNLRKTCSVARDCVDDVKPEPHINIYNIELDDEWSFELTDHRFQSTRYVGKDCTKTALNEFHTNLMHQNTSLHELRIVSHCPERYLWGGIHNEWGGSGVEFATRLGQFLQKRKHALKVETFSMAAMTHEEVMKVLPYVDKDSLRTIRISYPSYVDISPVPCELYFEVDQMATTEQWKSASQLYIEQPTITTPIPKMNITHFANVGILVNTMSSDDVSYLKTELLKSATLEKFKIKFRTSTIDERLHASVSSREIFPAFLAKFSKFHSRKVQFCSA